MAKTFTDLLDEYGVDDEFPVVLNEIYDGLPEAIEDV